MVLGCSNSLLVCSIKFQRRGGAGRLVDSIEARSGDAVKKLQLPALSICGVKQIVRGRLVGEFHSFIVPGKSFAREANGD
jgi:hypothetical protein